MRTKLYTINWILAFAFLALSGCSDDFVDVDSQDENSEDFFKTPEDYDLALVGAYDLLQSTYLNVMLGEIASDNTLAGGESANDVPGIQEIDNMEHTPVNQQLRDIWSWMFAGVNRANYVLEFQDALDFEGKTEIIAQARFLRAYYYFELVKWFGDVPLAVDSRIQFGEQFDIPRTPKAEVYAQIEQDLMFAAANLPAVQPVNGRITSGAAQALLGKAYLYQNKFAEAAAAFEPVINGPYSLVQDYSLIFEPEGENNSESIFEIQYSDEEGAGFGCLQCSEGNVAVGFNGVRNISYPNPDNAVFDSGFSFNVPVQEVVDEFSDNDVRKNVAILDIEAHAAATGASYSTGYEHTGYFNRKYIPRAGDLNTGDQNLTNPNNYRAIRLADVLLMAAEANFQSGNEDRARTYLNRVRNRAGLEDVSFSGNNLINQIYEDRRLELVGEGHRFFDLVRTGRAASEIDGFVTGKHELFPIPAIEIELAGNNWEQNPGY